MKNGFNSVAGTQVAKDGSFRTAAPSRLRRRQHRGRKRSYSGFVRVPGLFRMWEIEDLVSDHADLHIEPSGKTDDGTPVYIVFRREGRRT